MRADQFTPLSEEAAARWSGFGEPGGRNGFVAFLGMVVEEVRLDYCRMRLPFRADHQQSDGVVHGGALASLVDTVVVPAIGSGYDVDTSYVTVSMNVNYLGAAREQDVVAEGWVTRRGRTMAFCRAEAWSGDRLVVEGSLVYAVRTPTTT